MEFLQNLFPQAPSYLTGLLGQEQALAAQQQAQQQGLLGLGLGLLQAAAPAPVRPSLGAGLAQGLAAGQQAYQNVFQQRVQEADIARKIQEQRQLEAEQNLARGLLPEILKPGVEGGQPQINFDALQRLLTQAPNVAKTVLPNLEAYRKFAAPERLKVGAEETVFEVTPEGMRPIATGMGKAEKPAGAVLEAMQVLGIATPVTELTADQRKSINEYIDRKELLKTPKVSVDLSDPTAVAKAQQSVINDWRSVLKDVNAFEIGARYNAAADAVRQGNLGNKAADGALVYAVAKIYDPSGAVQEGDKATIIGSRSVPETVKAYTQKLINGQTFLPEERANLLRLVTEQVMQRAQMVEQQLQPYAQLSKNLGGDASLLLNPLADVLKQGTATAPSPQSLQEAAAAELRRRRGQ